MYHFGPNETYLLGYDALVLSQALLLAYLLALGSSSTIKKWVDRVVLSYFLYALTAAPVGRSMYQLAPDGMYDHFGQLPPYMGVDYQTWNAVMSSLMLIFLLISMHLWYALLRRKIDLPMILAHAVIFSSIVLLLLNKETLITSRDNNVLFQAIIIPMYLYGLGIMGNGLRKLSAGIEKKRLRIFFWAYMIPFMAIFVLLYLNGRDLITVEQFNMCLLLLGGLRALLFVWAIVIYGVFRMDLTYASEDIFENMDDPVMLLSPKDEIMRSNSSAKKYFGITEDAEHLDQRSIKELVPNYSQSSANFELSINTENGVREYNCAKTTIVRRKELIGSVLLFRDVTREKELARMKTDFTSTVSHELRTPLTSVLGFAKIIQKRFNEVVLANYQPSHKKEMRAVNQIGQNLEVIISESKRLTSLINDVLDISKMEAGRIDWRFSRCNLNGIIEQSIQATAGLFGGKPVELMRDIPPELPEIVADSDRMIQVIINLISNAVKFTDEGAVTIKVEREKGNLLVHVTDTGTGISKADQKLVFDKYKQAGNVITDKPQGTGLGLPISKQIVEQHGGKIWVESILGEGTTFSFSVPLADLPQTLQSPVSFEDLLAQVKLLKYSPVEGRKKVLLIDDEASIRQILHQSFEELGYQVIESDDGSSGVEAAYQHNPDVIVLDVMMPKMNGFDVAATLKNDPAYMSIPIIMLTVVDDAQRIYGLGVERYITKPFEPEHIVTQAEFLLKSRNEAKSAILLGNLGSRVEKLRKALFDSGYTLHVAADLEALRRLIETHKTDFLIVGENTYVAPDKQVELQAAIGTTSVLTRTVALK